MTTEELQVEESSEIEELLPANILFNLVMCNKEKTLALDTISDKLTVIVYEKKATEKGDKWVKAPGPYHPTISQALHHVRELMRRRKLAEAKDLDSILDQEKAITKEIFETFDAGFRDMKMKLFEKPSISKSEAELSSRQKPEVEKAPPTVLSSEELLAIKKASALSTEVKRRGRPSRKV